MVKVGFLPSRSESVPPVSAGRKTADGGRVGAPGTPASLFPSRSCAAPLAPWLAYSNKQHQMLFLPLSSHHSPSCKVPDESSSAAVHMQTLWQTWEELSMGSLTPTLYCCFAEDTQEEALVTSEFWYHHLGCQKFAQNKNNTCFNSFFERPLSASGLLEVGYECTSLVLTRLLEERCRKCWAQRASATPQWECVFLWRSIFHPHWMLDEI